MLKKELLECEKVAFMDGAEIPTPNRSLEGEEARQNRRHSRTYSGGMDSSEDQRPAAFNMGTVVEDGGRPGEQTLREQASADSMAAAIVWSAKDEQDLLESSQPRANTAGPTAGTDRESSRHPKSLPSDQRHISSSVEQQLQELRSSKQRAQESNYPADNDSGQFKTAATSTLYYQQASRDSTEESQVAECSYTPRPFAYHPDQRAIIAQSPNSTLPYGNLSGPLFGQRRPQGRVGPALLGSNQGLPSCDLQHYPDGTLFHNHFSCPENIQSQHHYAQRQGAPTQLYSTLVPQQEISSRQHYQGGVGQDSILQPQYQEKRKSNPLPPNCSQLAPQRGQFGFEQSYTGGNKQVFQPPRTTLTPQGRFQSSQQYHGKERQASHPQYSPGRDQTQRQLPSRRLHSERPCENSQQSHIQRRPYYILNGYNSSSLPEYENLHRNLEFLRPSAQHNDLSQSSLSDLFIRQKDSKRSLRPLSRQSSIEKRERSNKDTTFWKALLSLGRKKSGPLASSDRSQYQPAPSSFVSDRFASHPFAGIYPKGPVSTAYLEKVLNDQEELLEHRKRASQSSAEKSIPQKRIGTTQRLLNRLNFKNRKASSNRTKGKEEEKLQSKSLANLREPYPPIFQEAQVDLLEIHADRAADTFKAAQEVSQTSRGQYHLSPIPAFGQTPNCGNHRQFLTEIIYDTAVERSCLPDGSQQFRSRTTGADYEHIYSHPRAEKHSSALSDRGRRRSQTLNALIEGTNRAASFVRRRSFEDGSHYESRSPNQEIFVQGQQSKSLAVPRTRRRGDTYSKKSNHLPEALSFDGHEVNSPSIFESDERLSIEHQSLNSFAAIFQQQSDTQILQAEDSRSAQKYRSTFNSPQLPSDPREITGGGSIRAQNHPRSQYLFSFNQDLEEAKREEVEALEHILDLVRIKEPKPEEIDCHIQDAIEEAQIESAKRGTIVRSEFELSEGEASNPQLQQAIRDEAARQIKGNGAIKAFHNEIDQIPDLKNRRDQAKLQSLKLFENNSALLLKRGYSVRKQKNRVAACRSPGPTTDSVVQSRPAELNCAVQQRGDFSRDHRCADRDRSHQAQPRVKEQPVQQLYQVSSSDIVDGRSRPNPFQLRGAPASWSDIDRVRSRPIQSKKIDTTVSCAFGVVLKPAVSREDPSVDSLVTSKGSSVIPEEPTEEAGINSRILSNGSRSGRGLFSDNSYVQYKIELDEEASRRKESKHTKSAKERALRQRTVSKETVAEREGSQVVDHRERVLPHESRRGITRRLLPHNSPSLKKNQTSVAQLAQRFRSEEEKSNQKRGQQAVNRAVRKPSGSKLSQSSKAHQGISKDPEIPSESQVTRETQRQNPNDIQDKDQGQASGSGANAVLGRVLDCQRLDPSSGRSNNTPPTSGSRIPRLHPLLATSRSPLTDSRPALTSSAAAPIVNQQVQSRSATGPSTQQQRHRGTGIASKTTPTELRTRPTSSSSHSVIGPTSQLRSFTVRRLEERGEDPAKPPFLGSRRP